MSQSIKLNDNNFVDAEGVWDNVYGKNQHLINYSFRALYYDANTNRAVQADREAAIKAVLDDITFSIPMVVVFTIRYSGGYYFSYIATYGQSTNVNVLEYTIYDSMAVRIYGYNRSTKVCAQYREI